MRLGINGRFYGQGVKGVQRYAREIARRIADQEEVCLLVPGDVSRPSDLPNRAAAVRGRLRGHLWEQLELPLRARASGCSPVLHLTGRAPAWGGPHVIVVHDVTPITDPHWFNPIFARWYRLALRRAAVRAARIVTFSEWGKREVARVLGVSEHRIAVVSQGLAPFAAPASASAVARVRQRWSLTGPYVLATGYGDPRKNLSLLFEALQQWREQSADAPSLVVVGQPAPRIHGRQPTEDEALNGHMCITGYVSDDDLHALYTGADLFCYPSHKEGFGRPPLEAMACGTPVVVAPYDTAPEVLGPSAPLVPPHPQVWRSTMEELLGNPELRARRITDGRRHAAAYTWERAAAQVLEVCRNVAAEQQHRS